MHRCSYKMYAPVYISFTEEKIIHVEILGFHVPRGYNTMADGGQIMRIKPDSNEILLYN